MFSHSQFSVQTFYTISGSAPVWNRIISMCEHGKKNKKKTLALIWTLYHCSAAVNFQSGRCIWCSVQLLCEIASSACARTVNIFYQTLAQIWTLYHCSAAVNFQSRLCIWCSVQPLCEIASSACPRKIKKTSQNRHEPCHCLAARKYCIAICFFTPRAPPPILLLLLLFCFVLFCFRFLFCCCVGLWFALLPLTFGQQFAILPS